MNLPARSCRRNSPSPRHRCQRSTTASSSRLLQRSGCSQGQVPSHSLPTWHSTWSASGTVDECSGRTSSSAPRTTAHDVQGLPDNDLSQVAANPAAGASTARRYRITSRLDCAVSGMQASSRQSSAALRAFDCAVPGTRNAVGSSCPACKSLMPYLLIMRLHGRRWRRPVLSTRFTVLDLHSIF